MAIRQPYRGNPELKQYYLINDFSGGINTVSIDEKLRDNEFREMVNAELTTKGAVENRKGFGALEHLMTWLDFKSVTIPDGYTNFLKIIKSDNNVLKWANDYTLYADFATQMNNTVYDLKILFNKQENGTIKFYVLNVTNTDGTALNATVTLEEKMSLSGTLKNTKNINTIQYVEKIYFLSYDVYTTADAEYRGFCIYDLDESALTVMTSDDTYTPTPYEVEAAGFNVLRTNPLTDVATQGFGDFSLLGSYITDTQGRVIEKIPNDGNFNLVVFQVGEDMKHQHIVLTLKDQNDRTLDFTLEPITDGGGFFNYPIRNLLLTNVTSVTVSFTQNEDIQNATKLPEVDEQDFGIYTGTELHFGRFSEFLNASSFATSNVRVIRENFTLTETTTQTPNISVTVSPGFNLIDVYRAIASQQAQFYADPVLNSIVLVDDGSGNTYYTVGGNGFSRKYFTSSSTNIGNFLLGIQSTQLVTQETLLYDGANYYGYAEYNTVNDDFVDDFVQIGEPQEVLDFTTSFDIGTNEDVEITESIDLDGAKIVQIQDRLVVYKGNSIYFSEQFQYDYIPSYNYILLPLKATDEITHINFFRGVYIIFTRESIWRLSGLLSGVDLSILKVNDFIGCIAPDSVRALNNNLMFLSNQGLYVLTQSYYQEGLENVKKVDDDIHNLVVLDENAYAVMYRDQYWLMSETENYSTLKYYFNVNKIGTGHPFVIDKYTISPDNIEVYNGVIYSLKDGVLYRYDRGHTDFMPISGNPTVDNYTYEFILETKDDPLGYPTHNKKYKYLFLKTKATYRHPLYLTVYLEDAEVITPYTWQVDTNDTTGEITYTQVLNASTVTGGTRFIVGGSQDEEISTEDGSITYDATTTSTSLEPSDYFTIGEDYLGGKETIVHKFILSLKGKTIGFRITQKHNSSLSLQDFGFLYKLGKVKES